MHLTIPSLSHLLYTRKEAERIDSVRIAGNCDLNWSEPAWSLPVGSSSRGARRLDVKRPTIRSQPCRKSEVILLLVQMEEINHVEETLCCRDGRDSYVRRLIGPGTLRNLEGSKNGFWVLGAFYFQTAGALVGRLCALQVDPEGAIGRPQAALMRSR